MKRIVGIVALGMVAVLGFAMGANYSKSKSTVVSIAVPVCENAKVEEFTHQYKVRVTCGNKVYEFISPHYTRELLVKE